MILCFIPDINLCQHLFWDCEKLNFFKQINVANRMSIGFVKFETKQDQFVFGLVSLNCWLRLLEYFFWVIFLERNGIFLLLPPSRNYFNALTGRFCTLSLPVQVKYYHNS